jgi:hypothetical protein
MYMGSYVSSGMYIILPHITGMSYLHQVCVCVSGWVQSHIQTCILVLICICTGWGWFHLTIVFVSNVYVYTLSYYGWGVNQ